MKHLCLRSHLAYCLLKSSPFLNPSVSQPHLMKSLMHSLEHVTYSSHVTGKKKSRLLTLESVSPSLPPYSGSDSHRKTLQGRFHTVCLSIFNTFWYSHSFSTEGLERRLPHAANCTGHVPFVEKCLQCKDWQFWFLCS